MGAFLDKPKVEKRTNAGVGNGLRFGTSAMQGWRVEMEDADTARIGLPNGFDSWSFFGVFDGHAGAYVSKYCSEHLLDAIVSNENFTKAVKKLDAIEHSVSNSCEQYTDLAKESVRLSFIELDKNIRNIIEEGEKSGSTAVVVLVSPTHVYFGNCGDSRGIYCRNGKVAFATSDHKPVNPEEKSRIEKAGGSVMIQRINGSLAVSRALGDFEYKMEPQLSATEQLVSPEPEVSCLKRENGDEFVLLACDGVWDVMSNEEVIGFIRAKMLISNDLVYVCNELMDTCLAKGSRDNMSVILVAFPEAPVPCPEAIEKEKELNRCLAERVREIASKCDPEELDLTHIMQTLGNETMDGLPPGGGLSSKRNLIEGILNQVRTERGVKNET